MSISFQILILGCSDIAYFTCILLFCVIYLNLLCDIYLLFFSSSTSALFISPNWISDFITFPGIFSLPSIFGSKHADAIDNFWFVFRLVNTILRIFLHNLFLCSLQMFSLIVFYNSEPRCVVVPEHLVSFYSYLVWVR